VVFVYLNFDVLAFNHIPAIGFTNALQQVEYFDVMKDLLQGTTRAS